jgi:polysaccharide pyruvyl transferase WcaK-like protein
MTRVIGLLSPCGWGNLGDAAIQDSVIQYVRAHLPDAELVAFTLNPADTTRRHGVAAYAISGYSNSGYLIASAPPRFTALARLPVLGRLVRVAHAVAREVVHWLRVWRWSGKLDYLLVSGGGQLDEFWGGPWGHPYALWKWSFVSRLRRVPVIFLSVGWGTVKTGLSRWFVRHALSLAKYRSFRDTQTRDLVTQLPVTSPLAVLPDLAFGYAAGKRAAEPPRGVHGRSVAVSPIAHRDPRVWPEVDPQAYATYVERQAAFVADLVQRGWQVVMIATAGADRRTIADVRTRLAERLPSAQLSGCVLEPPVLEVEDCLAHFAAVECIVASRLHSVILGQLAGKPVLAVSYDWKVDRLMADVGQSTHCVDIDRADSAALIQAFDRLLADRERVAAAVAATCERYRVQVRKQFDEVFA